MCVLALAWKAPHWRLLLIGNRDEFHARPTSPLRPWLEMPLLGGRDKVAGGSWLATDGHGRMGVLTVRDPAANTDGPSRGRLIASYLQHFAPR